MIAPYAAQVRLLRELLAVPGLEIDSVDGFQGREKEAVVISLVRSNPKGEIGFLADVRRMNVAMTRARRKLLVVGDSATLAGHPFYQRMIEYFEGLGAYRTVWEEGGRAGVCHWLRQRRRAPNPTRRERSPRHWQSQWHTIPGPSEVSPGAVSHAVSAVYNGDAFRQSSPPRRPL